MTTLERLNTVITGIDEGTTEILAELATLRNALPPDTLSPEAEAALSSIEAKVNALKDISPPVA